jgi:four helix bundle protein
MKQDSIVYQKAKHFAVRIVLLKRELVSATHEFSIADQLLRSGTSIGANLAEAMDSISRREFHAKVCISLKECAETRFWLELLQETDLIGRKIYLSLMEDLVELQKMLTAICKTLQKSEIEDPPKT